jgi:outer membrane protein TolC
MITMLRIQRAFSALFVVAVLFRSAVPASAQVTRLDIEQSLERALRTNKALQYARLDYRFEVSRYDLSLRDFLPAISVGYARDDKVAYYAPDSRLKELSIGIDQLVYAGGARIYERRNLAAGLRVRERMIQEMEKELRLEVVNRFVEILKLGLQTRILEESLAMARDQVSIAAEEVKLGEITRLDYIEIELAVQDLEIELATLQQEEVRLKFELKELLQVPSNHSLLLSGAINPDFRGMLPDRETHYYVECALEYSLDLRKQQAEIKDLSNRVKQARCSWLPRMSTLFELSVSGESFPLTNPGFSVGINLDFSAPLAPLHTGITAGSGGAEERSLGLSSSVEVGENLMGWQTPRIARIGLRKAETKMETARKALEFSILQQLKGRSFLLDAIRLGEKRLELEEQRLSIEALMLDIGEITRLEYLESGIDFTRQRIDHLSRIVSLFQMEAILLAKCGLDTLERSHRHVLGTVSEELY